MAWNLQEVRQEYQQKHRFGLLFAITVVPLVALETDEVPETEDLFGEDIKVDGDQMTQLSLKSLYTNSLLRSRLTALFDEMEKAGVFN